MKTAVPIFFLSLSTLLSCTYYVVLDCRWYWAILVGFASVYVPVISLSILHGWLAWTGWLPIRLQRPFYLHWKECLKKKRIHPLVDYQLIIFVELHLDAEFEEGGFPQAIRATETFLRGLPDKLVEAVQKSIRSFPQPDAK